ncbi:MAG: hypothetical protein KDA60_11945, partial [Planctomycetales bacterium]|nr:hypothetical protein [Planctomycetales bacterium]
MSRYRVSVILVSVLAFAGCDAPDARFRLNMAYLNKQEEAVGAEFSPEQVQDVADILASMFGTPDQPFVPAAGDSGVRELVSLDRLEMAAGPVSSDEDGTAHGLYRKHCVHCHGITGDGAGPTAAFLNPYPRDYRKGEFKAKSTPIGVRPTDEDLKRILTEGIAGT